MTPGQIRKELKAVHALWDNLGIVESVECVPAGDNPKRLDLEVRVVLAGTIRNIDFTIDLGTDSPCPACDYGSGPTGVGFGTAPCYTCNGSKST